MAVVRNMQEYRQLQLKRIDKLRKVKNRTPIDAAKFMAAQLRLMAPRDTGTMIRNIVRRKSSVRVARPRFGRKTKFSVVHWVNETPGTNITSYGRKYSQVRNRTGVPRFHQFASKKTRKYFREITVNKTRQALRVSV